MTQDEIIHMAREAGLPVDDSLGFPLAHLNESTIFAFNLWIGRFAALVAAHEREKLAEQEPVFSSKCPKCDHKVISTHIGEVWWCPKCQHEWPFEKAAQKPVATPDVCGEVCERAKLCYGCGKNLDEANAEHERKYAAPVRTKDLTDDELNELWHNTKGGWLGLFRAVIAADREKNK